MKHRREKELLNKPVNVDFFFFESEDKDGVLLIFTCSHVIYSILILQHTQRILQIPGANLVVP